MTQRAIPCVLMRGGTSRGPYFHAADLPSDPGLLDDVLLRVMGSPDLRQIDGMGGATTVTSKVAIVSPSNHPAADVDYLFGQVDIEQHLVDWEPTCGNMLSGVGPFAIEEGLVPATHGETALVIRNVNTESFIDAVVQTPNSEVTYDGDYAIAGVPGTGAPIDLRFREITGSHTGTLLPTGNAIDVLDGVDATCIDVAMPMVIVSAADVGFTGNEDIDTIHGDRRFMEQMETIRQLAGKAMGLGDVTDKVIPKFAMVAPPQRDGHIMSRYLTPSQCHPAYAVSGSIAAASSALVPGSVTHRVARADGRLPEIVEIEHPSGSIEVRLHTQLEENHLTVHSGGAMRTARRLFAGHVFIPQSVWP